jgi:hypothetical protein
MLGWRGQTDGYKRTSLFRQLDFGEMNMNKKKSIMINYVKTLNMYTKARLIKSMKWNSILCIVLIIAYRGRH